MIYTRILLFIVYYYETVHVKNVFKQSVRQSTTFVNTGLNVSLRPM